MTSKGPTIRFRRTLVLHNFWVSLHSPDWPWICRDPPGCLLSAGIKGMPHCTHIEGFSQPLQIGQWFFVLHHLKNQADFTLCFQEPGFCHVRLSAFNIMHLPSGLYGFQPSFKLGYSIGNAHLLPGFAVYCYKLIGAREWNVVVWM